MRESIRVKRIRVGDDVQSYCGRCKAERAHLVAAMKSDTLPAQVICRTCQTRHGFRAGADAGVSPGRAKPEARAVGRQQSAPGRHDAAPARPYSTKERYTTGDAIEHPRYGIGRVEEARGAKIDVRFGDGMRTLIHAG